MQAGFLQQCRQEAVYKKLSVLIGEGDINSLKRKLYIRSLHKRLLKTVLTVEPARSACAVQAGGREGRGEDGEGGEGR